MTGLEFLSPGPTSKYTIVIRTDVASTKPDNTWLLILVDGAIIISKISNSKVERNAAGPYFTITPIIPTITMPLLVPPPETNIKIILTSSPPMKLKILKLNIASRSDVILVRVSSESSKNLHEKRKEITAPSAMQNIKVFTILKYYNSKEQVVQSKYAIFV